MLEIEGLSCRYGKVNAILELSLRVDEGELVSLIGANGAGKTTTLKAISGVLNPVAGQIIFDGKDITRASPRTILASGIAHDLKRIIARFPVLEERRRQMAGTLSGGEQQMLAIGRALMSRPKLIMFDEPSLGLAPNLVETTFEIISEIRAEGVTVLMVEQNAYAALELCDRSYLLESGKVVLRGTGEELLTDDHVKRAYLGG